MSNFLGWGGRIRGLFADTKGPWGGSTGSGADDGGSEPPADEGKGSGPWGEPPRRRVRVVVRALDDILHARPRLIAHPPVAIDDAGDGGPGHASEAGDLLERHRVLQRLGHPSVWPVGAQGRPSLSRSP